MAIPGVKSTDIEAAEVIDEFLGNQLLTADPDGPANTVRVRRRAVVDLLAGEIAAQGGFYGGMTIYPNSAAGLGVAAEGAYFLVTSAVSGEYAILYRKVSGVASEINRLPNAAAVTALAGSVAAEATARAAAVTAVEARVTAAETNIGVLQGNLVSSYTAARAVDGLDALGGKFRNLMAQATAGKGINTSGAEVTAGANLASGFIEVGPSTVLTRIGTAIASGSIVPYAFYNASGVFLGAAYTGSDTIHSLVIADVAPAGTTRVRLSGLAAVTVYAYDRASLRVQRDALFGKYGLPADAAGNLVAGYVNKTTGAVATGGSYFVTGLLPITAGAYISCDAALISPSSANQAQLAFYGPSGYLGYVNPIAVGQIIRVADYFPSATGVRVTMPPAGTGAVYIVGAAPGLAEGVDMLVNGALVDYFSPGLVVGGRLTGGGGITQPTHEYWRTTKSIPVTAGQVFRLTAQDVTDSGGAPVVAGYNADGTYWGPILTAPTNADFLNYRLEIPVGPVTMKVTFRIDKPPYSLFGARTAQAAQETSQTSSDTIYLAPTEAYGRLGEDMYLYGRGIVPDRAVSVAWAPGAPGQFDDFEDIGGKLHLKKTAAGPATVQLRAIKGTGRIAIAPAIDIRLVNAPVSPTVPLNIFTIGDSTTSQLNLSGDPDAIDGDGTWVNEASRQLTGIGTAALTVGGGEPGQPIVLGDIRASLGLSNIFFRGTRGAGPVKHEGRGGWHPEDYLKKSVDGAGKVNAFWDAGMTPWGPAGTYRFSMQFYIESNGWDAASLSTGVLPDGSNAVVIIPLAWNDWGNGTEPGVSAGHMGLLIDKIVEQYPLIRVVVPSLWAPPAVMIKQNSGSTIRWLSDVEAYDSSVRAFGEAYRNMCASRPRATWLQVSHQMDADISYNLGKRKTSRMANDPSMQVTGVAAFPHMMYRGYGGFGDVIADWIAYHCCQAA